MSASFMGISNLWKYISESHHSARFCRRLFSSFSEVSAKACIVAASECSVQIFNSSSLSVSVFPAKQGMVQPPHLSSHGKNSDSFSQQCATVCHRILCNPEGSIAGSNGFLPQSAPEDLLVILEEGWRNATRGSLEGEGSA